MCCGPCGWPLVKKQLRYNIILIFYSLFSLSLSLSLSIYIYIYIFPLYQNKLKIFFRKNFFFCINWYKLSPSKKKIPLPHHKMKASKSSHPHYQLIIDPKPRPNHSQNLDLAADWPHKAIPSQDRFIQKWLFDP